MEKGASLFDTLWVIESLPADDLKTGRTLYETKLAAARAKHSELTVHFEAPATASEMLALLEKIHQSTTKGSHPMLHFECHGCPDGLATASGELIGWEELRIPLIEINYASQMNLVVVLAACNGAHLIKVATRLDRAPFWAVIGPDEEITAGAAETDFGAFYEEFFNSLSGDEAMKELNKSNAKSKRRYQFLSAEGLFLRAYAKYHHDHCVGSGKQRRIEYLLTEALQNPIVRRLGVPVVRQMIKRELLKLEPYFGKKKAEFFFLDVFPSNSSRFGVGYEDVLAFPKPRRPN